MGNNCIYLLIFTIYVFWCDAIRVNENDKFLDTFSQQEERIGHKRRRPCRGRANEPNGRTFFDWSFQYENINYNYNYNINCGENGGNKPIRPIGQHPIGQGIGQGINKPGQGIFNGNRPGGGLLQGLLGSFSQSQSQSQSQAEGGGFPPPQLPSNLPSMGDIFGSFLSLLPQNGFGDFFSGANNAFSGQLPQLPQTRPPINTPKPQIPVTTLDPDDTIYNDVNKPVNEDYDPVVPDKYSTNKRPGSYNGYYSQNRYPNQNNYYYNRRRQENYGQIRPEGRNIQFPTS